MRIKEREGRRDKREVGDKKERRGEREVRAKRWWR